MMSLLSVLHCLIILLKKNELNLLKIFKQRGLSTADTDIYKGNYFSWTIRDWNALPESVISSAEVKDDCIAKFTSLVRTGTNFPNYKSW